MRTHRDAHIPIFNLYLRFYLAELYKTLNIIYLQIIRLNKFVRAYKYNLTDYFTELSSTFTQLNTQLNYAFIYLYTAHTAPVQNIKVQSIARARAVAAAPGLPHTVMQKSEKPVKPYFLTHPMALYEPYKPYKKSVHTIIPSAYGGGFEKITLKLPDEYTQSFERLASLELEDTQPQLARAQLFLQSSDTGKHTDLQADKMPKNYSSIVFRTIIDLNQSAYYLKASVQPREIADEAYDVQKSAYKITPDSKPEVKKVSSVSQKITHQLFHPAVATFIMYDIFKKQHFTKILHTKETYPAVTTSIDITENIQKIKYTAIPDIVLPAKTVFEKRSIMDTDIMQQPKPTRISEDDLTMTTHTKLEKEVLHKPVPHGKMRKIETDSFEKKGTSAVKKHIPKETERVNTTFKTIQIMNAGIITTAAKIPFLKTDFEMHKKMAVLKENAYALKKTISKIRKKDYQASKFTAVIPDVQLKMGKQGVLSKEDTEKSTLKIPYTADDRYHKVGALSTVLGVIAAPLYDARKKSSIIQDVIYRYKKMFISADKPVVHEQFRKHVLKTKIDVNVFQASKLPATVKQQISVSKMPVILPDLDDLQKMQKKVQKDSKMLKDIELKTHLKPDLEFKEMPVVLSPDRAVATATTTIPVSTVFVKEMLKPIHTMYAENIRTKSIIPDALFKVTLTKGEKEILPSSAVQTMYTAVLPDIVTYTKISEFVKPDLVKHHVYFETTPDRQPDRQFVSSTHKIFADTFKSAQMLAYTQIDIYQTSIQPVKELQKSVHSTYLQHLLKTYTYTPDELHVLTKTGIKDTATLIPTVITQKAKLQKDFYYYTHITPRITAQPEIIVTKRTELPYTLPDNLIARSIATLRHLKKEELANISKKTEVDIEKTVLQLLDVEKPKTEKELKKLIQDALNELVEAEAKQYGVL